MASVTRSIRRPFCSCFDLGRGHAPLEGCTNKLRSHRLRFSTVELVKAELSFVLVVTAYDLGRPTEEVL